MLIRLYICQTHYTLPTGATRMLPRTHSLPLLVLLLGPVATTYCTAHCSDRPRTNTHSLSMCTAAGQLACITVRLNQVILCTTYCEWLPSNNKEHIIMMPCSAAHYRLFCFTVNETMQSLQPAHVHAWYCLCLQTESQRMSTLTTPHSSCCSFNCKARPANPLTLYTETTQSSGVSTSCRHETNVTELCSLTTQSCFCVHQVVSIYTAAFLGRLSGP